MKLSHGISVSVGNLNQVEFKGLSSQSQEKDIEFDVFSLDAPAQGIAGPKTPLFFKLKLVDPNMGVRFKLTTTEGTAGVYIPTETTPTENIHTWAASSGASDEVLVLPSHKSFSTWFFISVYGFRRNASITLCAEEVAPEEVDAKSSGQQLGRLENNAAVRPPNSKQCPTCLAWISNSGFMMHTIRCKGKDFRCPICDITMKPRERKEHVHCPKCQKGMKRDELDAHVQLVHREVKCECGAIVSAMDMPSHKKNQCMLRKQVCKWCKAAFPQSDLKDHERYCGSKSTQCELCGKSVAARLLVNHKAAVHGINPCFDPSPSISSGSSSSSSSSSSSNQQDDDLQRALAASMVGLQGDDAELQRAIAASRQESMRPQGRNTKRNKTSEPRASRQNSSRSSQGPGAVPMVMDPDMDQDMALQQALLMSMMGMDQ